MPQSVTIAAFVFGAVLILIALVGGGFKIFGAEIPKPIEIPARFVAAILGLILIFIGIGLSGPLPDHARTPSKPPSTSPRSVSSSPLR